MEEEIEVEKRSVRVEERKWGREEGHGEEEGRVKRSGEGGETRGVEEWRKRRRERGGGKGGRGGEGERN